VNKRKKFISNILKINLVPSWLGLFFSICEEKKISKLDKTLSGLFLDEVFLELNFFLHKKNPEKILFSPNAITKENLLSLF